MNAQRHAQITAVSLALVAVAPTAFAQTEVLKEEDVQKKALAATSTTVPDGWKINAKLGLGANLVNTNSNAEAAGAGQAGTSFQFSILLGAEANFKHGQNDWETKLNIQHGQTKTPNIAPFIKSVDNLEVISTYFYRLQNPKWLGPFGRFKFQTQIFKGFAVRDAVTTVNTFDADGAALDSRSYAAQTKIPLTSTFEPILMRESAGMFARPWQDDSFKLDGKLGVGAQQMVMRDGFVVAGEAGGALELRQLGTSNSIGAEAELILSGVLVKDLLSWKASANFFLPVVSSANDPEDPTKKANGFGYLNTDIQGGLSIKISKWASVDYQLLLRRNPLIVKGFQVQHGLVFSAGFDIL